MNRFHKAWGEVKETAWGEVKETLFVIGVAIVIYSVTRKQKNGKNLGIHKK